eukprot:567159-Prorocentrum_lima.AAC.1
MRAWMAVMVQLGIPHPSKTVRIQCQGSRSNALLWSAYSTAVVPWGWRAWACWASCTYVSCCVPK